MNTQPLHPAEAIAGNRVKTLLVDDSPLMLKIVAEILRQAGNFDVVGSASNGYQAIRYVRMLSPELIVMDVHMPRLDGIHATRYLKQCEHPPTVIIVTSDDSPVTRAAAELAGADGFISKDLNLRQQMIDTLRKIFAPPGDTQSTANDESHLHCVTRDEKSENEHAPTINQRSRCTTFRLATSPGKNPTACERRLRRVRRSGTHELARVAQGRATIQNKVPK